MVSRSVLAGTRAGSRRYASAVRVPTTLQVCQAAYSAKALEYATIALNSVDPIVNECDSNSGSEVSSETTRGIPVDFIILSTMRSGSNNLQDALNRHPEIECAGEIYNPGQLTVRGRIFEQRDDRGLARNGLIRVVTHAAGYGKRWCPGVMLKIARPARSKPLYGFRLFGDHIARFELMSFLDRLHARGTRFIHLVRRDTFDQAVSLVRARASGVWKVRPGTTAPPAEVDLLAQAGEIKWAAELMHGHKVVTARAAKRYAAMLLDYDAYTSDENSYDLIQDFLGVHTRTALRHANLKTSPVDADVYRRLREELGRRQVPMRFDPETL